MTVHTRCWPLNHAALLSQHSRVVQQLELAPPLFTLHTLHLFVAGKRLSRMMHDTTVTAAIEVIQMPGPTKIDLELVWIAVMISGVCKTNGKLNKCKTNGFWILIIKLQPATCTTLACRQPANPTPAPLTRPPKVIMPKLYAKLKPEMRTPAGYILLQMAGRTPVCVCAQVQCSQPVSVLGRAS